MKFQKFVTKIAKSGENKSFAKNVKVPNSWRLINIKCRFKQRHFLWFLPLPTHCYVSFPLHNLYFYLISHAILPWFAASSLHFCIVTLIFCILHIFTQFLKFPTWLPTFLSFSPWLPTLPLPFPMLPPLLAFSPHSVPWLLIQAFTDSHFLLLTQYIIYWFHKIEFINLILNASIVKLKYVSPELSLKNICLLKQIAAAQNFSTSQKYLL